MGRPTGSFRHRQHLHVGTDVRGHCSQARSAQYISKVIAIEILPRIEEFGNTRWEEVEDYFKKLVDEVNATLPTTHRISKVTVRKEDFKRTGAMKVSRN